MKGAKKKKKRLQEETHEHEMVQAQIKAIKRVLEANVNNGGLYFMSNGKSLIIYKQRNKYLFQNWKIGSCIENRMKMTKKKIEAVPYSLGSCNRLVCAKKTHQHGLGQGCMVLEVDITEE